MPSKSTYEPGSFPEARGVVYDESEMALFHAKLSYHSTIDNRLASKDSNLHQISAQQVKIIKGWEYLKQKEKDMTEKGGSLVPMEKNQLRQFEWRFQLLESKANQFT